jgi:hypothetical protein
MFYKVFLRLLALIYINMTFRATEMCALAGGIRWSLRSSLEGEKCVVPVAVQVRAGKIVLKVNQFLEYVCLLQYYLARHLLTCNTDWSKLSESKAHHYRSVRISRSYNNLYSLIKHDFRANLLPNKHYKQLDSVRKFSFSVIMNNSHVTQAAVVKRRWPPNARSTQYQRISTAGRVAWSPCSPDINPLHFYVWGY